MTQALQPLVLIADDFADARELYGECLRLSGYRYAEAADGVEALDQAIALHPDLIVMDLSMPSMDGWEAARRLKADPRTSAIPIVALTGHSLTSHVERARAAGCETVITKPFLPTELVRLIDKILTRD